MRSRIVAGTIAGVAAGAVAGAFLSAMGVTSPQGVLIRVISILGQAVGSESILPGWVVLLAVSAIIGASFGALCGSRDPGYAAGLAAMYSLAWWLVGWLALMALALDSGPFAPLATRSLIQVAIAGLLAALVYAAVLAGTFPWLSRRAPTNEGRQEHRRAA